MSFSRLVLNGHRLSCLSSSLKFRGLPQRRYKTNNYLEPFPSIDIKETPKAKEIKTTVSMNDYAKLTFSKTVNNLGKVGVASGVSVVIGSGLMQIMDPLIVVGGGIFGSFGVAIYSLVKLSGETPTVVYNEKEKKHEIIDSPDRNMYLNMFLVAEGITISPMMCLGYNLVGPAVIITSLIMAGPIANAYVNPTKNIDGMGSFLFTSLLGMVGLSITGIIFPGLGQLWMQPEPYLGILLFSGYNWYDTQVMRLSYENNKLDPTIHSVNYTLNFINILIRVIEIMSRAQRNK